MKLLHTKGYEMTSECLRNGHSLAQGVFRMCSIEMVGAVDEDSLGWEGWVNAQKHFTGVPCVAEEALVCMCERMVLGAASLLLGMLNEEAEVVRVQDTAGYLSLHDH